jgi:hypothetical protein
MKHLASVLMSLSLASVASAGGAWKSQPAVEAEFKSSIWVVVGCVTHSETVSEDGDFIRGTFFTVRIAEVLKGAPPELIELYSENSSGRFPMEIGEPYLLFLSDQSFAGIHGLRLAVDSAGNSNRVGVATRALDVARVLRKKEPK